MRRTLSLVIFLATGLASKQERTDLATRRTEFLTLLVTDTWQQVSYGRYTDYKFRPIEGPFRGRRISFNADSGKLIGNKSWEYSPSSGALNIGYEEFVGGLVIGETLALVEEDGDQQFYKKKPGGLEKVFTVANVKTHDIDETKGSELAEVLSGQFQKESKLYSFEFNEDIRTGYFHEWQSQPFAITGNQLDLDRFNRKINKIYEVEDLVLFDEYFVLKRDATASRLRHKTESEVIADKTKLEKKLQELSETKLLLRIIGSDGNSHDFRLPFASIAEISGIQILTE